MADPITTATDLEEVELQGSVKVKMPKADAEAYRAARSKDKGERDALAQRIGTVDAEKRAAEAAAIEARAAAEIEKATKAGDFAKAQQLAEQRAQGKVDKVAGHAIAMELRAAVLKVSPGLDADSISDIVTLNRGRLRYNTETGTAEALDAAGQPLLVDGKAVGADALIAEFVKTRPHYRIAKVPRGDGQQARTSAGPLPTSITSAEYQALMDSGKWTRALQAALKAGTLTIE